NKDVEGGAVCDRADENSENPRLLPARCGASGCKRAHRGSRVTVLASRDLLQMLYRPRCIAGAFPVDCRRDPRRDGPPGRRDRSTRRAALPRPLLVAAPHPRLHRSWPDREGTTPASLLLYAPRRRHAKSVPDALKNRLRARKSRQETGRQGPLPFSQDRGASRPRSRRLSLLPANGLSKPPEGDPPGLTVM